MPHIYLTTNDFLTISPMFEYVLTAAIGFLWLFWLLGIADMHRYLDDIYAPECQRARMLLDWCVLTGLLFITIYGVCNG